MIVRFVDIGRIYHHHRLNFLFIDTQKVHIMIYLTFFLYFSHIIIYLTFIIFLFVLLYFSFLNIHNIYRGGSSGGWRTRRAPPPPKIGKKMIFWRKIPQIFSRLPPLGAIF